MTLRTRTAAITAPLILLCLLPLVCACGIIAGAVSAVTYPVRQTQYNLDNHRFQLKGVVVDEAGSSLTGVSMLIDAPSPRSYYVHGGLHPGVSTQTVSGQFGVDVHGTEVRLIFSKDGYQDTTLLFHPDHDRTKGQLPQDEFATQKASSLMVVMRKHSPDSPTQEGK